MSKIEEKNPLEIYDELVKKNEILRKAVFLMGKWIRENPSGEMDVYLSDPMMLKALCGGTSRDPEGKEIARIFVQKAINELEKEKVKDGE